MLSACFWSLLRASTSLMQEGSWSIGLRLPFIALLSWIFTSQVLAALAVLLMPPKSWISSSFSFFSPWWEKWSTSLCHCWTWRPHSLSSASLDARCLEWSPGCGGSLENPEKRAGPREAPKVPHKANRVTPAKRADGGREGSKSTGGGRQPQPLVCHHLPTPSSICFHFVSTHTSFRTQGRMTSQLNAS